MSTTQHLPEKLKQLIEDKESELYIVMLEVVQDLEKNAHILAKRFSDGSYIVWSSFYNGDDKTSYDGFYGGAYDLSLSAGLVELNRRAERKTNTSEPTLTHDETITILVEFFGKCKVFWTCEQTNFGDNYPEGLDVTQKALHDVANLRNDPHSPTGKRLDVQAQAGWLNSNGYIPKQ